MGYNTEFKGSFTFKNELTTPQMAKLNTILGEDVRDHKNWPMGYECTFIDLEFTPDFTGLQWDNSEKSHDMEDMLNLIMEIMQSYMSGFHFEGEMIAQGEDIDDRYRIVIENDFAVRKEIDMTGKKIKCPLCEGDFYLE
jgi:hypothetical protein